VFDNEETYFFLLQDFITGKITREEFTDQFMPMYINDYFKCDEIFVNYDQLKSFHYNLKAMKYFDMIQTMWESFE
jgi:hypothetical protein